MLGIVLFIFEIPFLEWCSSSQVCFTVNEPVPEVLPAFLGQCIIDKLLHSLHGVKDNILWGCRDGCEGRNLGKIDLLILVILWRRKMEDLLKH